MYGVVGLALIGLISGARVLRKQERKTRMGLQQRLVELEGKLSVHESTIDEDIHEQNLAA